MSKGKIDYNLFNIPQFSESECGVACVVSVFNYFGVSVPREIVKKNSGTTNNGSSMLGLQEAAQSLGLTSEGFEGDIEELKKIESPSILHVTINESILHYVVCFGYHNGKFTIMDPAVGVSGYSDDDLRKIWKSKRLLIFQHEVDQKVLSSIFHVKRRKIELFDLIRPELKRLIPIVILCLVISILGLSLPVYLKFYIDNYKDGLKEIDTLMISLGILLCTLVIRSLLVYVTEFLFLRQSVRFNKKATDHFFKKILHLAMPFYDSMRKGDLITRMNDIIKIQSTVAYFVGTLLIEIFIFIAGCLFISLYMPLLSLTLLLAALGFIFLSFRQSKSVIEMQKSLMAAYGVNESVYVDTLTGIEIIKGNNKEEFFSKLSKVAYENFQVNLKRLALTKAKFNLLLSILGSIICIVAIALSSFGYYATIIDLGMFIGLIQVSLTIIPSIVNISLSNFRIQEAKVAFDRISEFSEETPECSSDDDEKMRVNTFKDLNIQHLKFKFPGTVALLEDVSFSIGKGEILAIVGKNGSGKSTLLRILQKFYPLPENTIWVNGMEWNSISVKNWRDQIAVVSQETKLFNGSVAANITLSENFQIEDVSGFFDKIGFKYLESLPESYNTIVGEGGISISGGQKQLVGIARALYKMPKLLMLDEATSFLDRDTQTKVFTLLRTLAKETSIAMIFVTHDDDLLQFADRTVFIN